MSEIELKACSENESTLTARATKQSAPKELWGRKLKRSERQCWAQGFNAAKSAKWQGIESAPKDGTRILLFGDGDQVVAYFNVDYGTWDDGDYHDDIQGLTHWQPLPAPPEVDG